MSRRAESKVYFALSVRGRPKGKRRFAPDEIFEMFLVYGVDVESWSGEDEVEASGGVVVAVDLAAMADVAFEAVHREVYAIQASGFVGFLATPWMESSAVGSFMCS